jgi:hypothetical protein
VLTGFNGSDARASSLLERAGQDAGAAGDTAQLKVSVTPIKVQKWRLNRDSERETWTSFLFAADRCPCVEKLRTCYQLLLASETVQCSWCPSWAVPSYQHEQAR